MKLVKSLLLGSAAGLAAVAGAQAADLPSKKAAPVEYVRVCSAHGAGFFYIPGSDTCIKIGGRVRFEYQYAQQFNRSGNFSGMRSLGRFELDARNSTEWGLLRAYTRIDFARRTGNIHSGSGVRQGSAFTGSGVDFTGNAQTQVLVDRAFVQLGGLTAGRSVSFFGFYNGDLEMVGTTFGDGAVTNLLAYTATFGSGFSATLSLEDPNERRNIITGPAGAPLPAGAITTVNATSVSALTASGYAGSIMPEIVAALRVDQGWGSAQLSGALHQVRAIGTTANPGMTGSTTYGYALNAGVKINLPMLAAGDAFYLQAAYTNGAVTYAMNNFMGYGASSQGIGALGRLQAVDAVVLANGSVQTTQVWAVTGGMLHYWTPKIRQGVFGSYGQINYGSAATLGFGGTSSNAAGLANPFRNWAYWTVGSNVYYSPVKGLDLGIEVDYQGNVLDGGKLNSGLVGPASVGALASSSGAWTTRIRVQRDF